MAGRPDEVAWHELGRCAGCSASLFGAPVTRTEKRQVVDLPERITEHIRRPCRAA
jgi:transposase